MKPFRIKDILGSFRECTFHGNENALLSEMRPITDLDVQAAPETIVWISDKTVDSLQKKIAPGLLILSSTAFEKLKSLPCNFLVSPNPRSSFQKILELKFAKIIEPKVEPTAIIDPSARIGKDCYIGHHVVIEKNVCIGDRVHILHHTVIMHDTMIGNDIRIGCNTTIGNYGFGYEKAEDGNYHVIHHIGNVVIEDLVEIGNNTAIDRAVMGSTHIGRNAKIDNLVHIAHGVVIGENSLIIANAMIAGSVVIGKNAWIAPSASVLNKKTVGRDTVVGMGAVVIRDVPDGDVVAGSPAKSLKK